MAENGALSTKQSKAVAALLSSRTTAEAARAAGVGARTITRWLGEDVFRAKLRRAQDEAVAAAVRRLVGGVGGALDTLAGVMDDVEVPAGARLRAAGIWLDVCLKWAELRDLQERVSALEEVLRAK